MAVVRVSSATRDATSGTAISTSTTQNTVAGNAMIVYMSWEDSPATMTSVTDSAGNTYTLGTLVTFSGGPYAQFAWCLNCSAHATNTVTANFASSAAAADLIAVQYSGLDTGAAVNAQATASSNTGSNSAATFKMAATATTETCLLLLGGKVYNNINFTPQTSDGVAWVEIVDLTHSCLDDKLNSGAGFAAGTYNGAHVATVNDAWCINFAAFKVAAGGAAAAITTTYFPLTGIQ